MLHATTLADLLDRNVPIRPEEAVAIVQQVLGGEASEGDAHQPYGPLAVDNVELTSDGHVRCIATAATPSVYEAAALLQSLISRTDGVVPGALRYTLGRALLEVEAPPFDSREQFAVALQRFERGPRAVVIAALASRAGSQQPRPHERRRATAASAALRRELLDADLRSYAAARATLAVTPRVAQQKRGGPLAACVLTGAALVFAGSVASTGSASIPSGGSAGASSNVTAATDIALPPQPAEPVTAPAPHVRPVADATATQRSARRAGASAGAARRAGSHPRREPQRTVMNTRSKTKRDADRGVIARIRFEWDNPFR